MNVTQALEASAIPDLTSNSTKNTECVMYIFVIQTLIIGSLIVAGLIGNIVSFCVFRTDKIKTSTSFLFQGLACIDSLLLLLSFPLYSVLAIDGIYSIPYKTTTTALSYGVFFPSAFVAQTATIWVTVLVAFNRFIAVCKPYQAARLCTVVQARKQVAIVVLLAILYNIPRFLETKLSMSDDGSLLISQTAYGANQLAFLIYGSVCYMIFLLIIPLSVLTLLNIRLIRALKEIKRKRAEMQSLRQQQDNNVTLVLIIVVLVFTICQVPALFTQIFWLVLDDDSRECGGFQFYYSRISNMLVITNSSTNFLIYFFFNTRFRQVLMQNICGREYEKVRTKSSNTVMTTVPHFNNKLSVKAPVNGNDCPKAEKETPAGRGKGNVESATIGLDNGAVDRGSSGDGSADTGDVISFDQDDVDKCKSTQEASTSPLATPL